MDKTLGRTDTDTDKFRDGAEQNDDLTLLAMMSAAGYAQSSFWAEYKKTADS